MIPRPVASEGFADILGFFPCLRFLMCYIYSIADLSCRICIK